MNEQHATLDFLCELCSKTTSTGVVLVLGENTIDVICSGCGEHWHILYPVLSLDPFIVGDWEIKRLLGIIQDGQFYAKEEMQ